MYSLLRDRSRSASHAIISHGLLVLATGLEPVLSIEPEPKSGESTNSTMPAY